MHPAERYRALIAEGKLTGDAAQERVAAALERLAVAFDDYKPGKRSLFGFGKATTPPRGPRSNAGSRLQRTGP